MAESNLNPWSSCPCLWSAWIIGVYHYFFSLPGDTRCPAEPGAQSRQKGLNGKLCAICILRHPLRTWSETGATECRSLIRYMVCKYYPLICGLFIRCLNWREQFLVFLKLIYQFSLAWVVPIRSSSFDFLIIYSEYFLYSTRNSSVDKAFAAKPDYLSSLYGAHVVKGENRLPWFALWPCSVVCTLAFECVCEFLCKCIFVWRPEVSLQCRSARCCPSCFLRQGLSLAGTHPFY